MTPDQLKEKLLEVLRNYWRQRAAIVIFKNNLPKRLLSSRMEYSNTPQIGEIINILNPESANISISSIEENLTSRVPKDLFMALLANFESFLSEALIHAGDPKEGTLGALQVAVQSHYSIQIPVIDKFDEIRERRNMIVHHHSQIKDKYKNAAAKVINPPYVIDPNTITKIDITPEYLGYAADCLIQYSRCVFP